MYLLCMCFQIKAISSFTRIQNILHVVNRFYPIHVKAFFLIVSDI